MNSYYNEKDNKKDASIYEKKEWKLRTAKHDYMEDAFYLNQLGKDNYVAGFNNHRQKEFGAPYENIPYWATNVTKLGSGDFSQRNSKPVPLKPLLKPGAGNPWAPHTFKPGMVYDTNIVPGKFIKY